MSSFVNIVKKKLQAELDNFPFEYSFEDYQRYNNEIETHFKVLNDLNRFYKKQLKLEKEYFRFIVLKNAQLVLSFKHYFDTSQKAKQDYFENTFSYKCLNDFWKIYIVISNNYLVLKDLLLNGKDYQAKVLFRNTIELTELCIGILGDEEFYSFFKKENLQASPEKAFQTIKFNTVKKVTQKIISEIKQYPNNNIPSVLWDGYLQIRQSFYEDSSRHIHANFLHLILGSYVPMIENKDLKIEDMMLMNLGGIINATTQRNIKDVIQYDALSYMVLLVLIIEKHRLHFSKLDKEVNHLVVLSKFNWDLLKHIH